VAEGMREVIGDPLASSPRENLPDRSLQTFGVRNPGQGPGNAYAQRMSGLLQAVDGMKQAVLQDQDVIRDQQRVEGKIAYMQGKAASEITDPVTMQGYQALSAVDQANKWYQSESLEIDQKGREMDPDDYAAYLKKKNGEQLANLSNDPIVRKTFVAAYDDKAPALAAAQFKAHHEWLKEKSEAAFGDVLDGTAKTDTGTPKRVAGGPNLAISDTQVSTPYKSVGRDRDLGIRTMLGEAASEGDKGLAAVALVMKNRVHDKRWGGSVARVVLEPKQFSTWNKGAGGNNPSRFSPASPLYQRAGKIYDAVMEGKVTDYTGGATHYYSPAGMKKLVNDGDQTNVIPRWLEKEASRGGGKVQIGGHIFVGKTENFSKPVEGNPNDQIKEVDGIPVYEKSPLGVDPATVASDIGLPPKASVGTVTAHTIVGFPGLSNESKAKVVANRMAAQLATGNSSLYDSVGGVAALNALGAQPELIDKVNRAYEAYSNKQDNLFNADKEKWLGETKNDIISGKKTADVARKEIAEREKAGLLSDQEAKAATRATFDAQRQYETSEDRKTIRDNPVYRDKLAGIVDMIRSDSKAVDLAEEARKLTTEFGGSDRDHEQAVNQVFQRLEAEKNKVRSEIDKTAREKANDDLVKSKVETVLHLGNGLGTLEGTIKHGTDRYGNASSISAKEYGIQQLNENFKKTATEMIQSGKMKEEVAPGWVETQTYKALKKQGVVDETLKGQIQGALSGNILDAKGSVSEGASRAFEFYRRMQMNPDIGSAYMAKTVEDNDTRTLLEQANLYYDGGLNTDDALKRAWQDLRDPSVDKTAQIEKSGKYYDKMNENIDTTVDNIMRDRSLDIFGFDLGLSSAVFTNSEQSSVIDRNKSFVKQWITGRSQAYFMRNQREDPLVSLKKASDDFENHAVVVGDSITLGNPNRKERLDQVLGLEGYDRTKTSEVLNEYLDAHMSGHPTLGTIWDKSQKSTTLGVGRLLFGFDTPRRDDQLGTRPDYDVRYSPSDRQIVIQVYKDKSKGEFYENPVYIRTEDIKNWYGKKAAEPSFGANVVRKLKEGVADILPAK
jgi:spore germination cell wall hydrolase CwlJ-like protein